MSLNPTQQNFAVIIPMANESQDFAPFVQALKTSLDALQNGKVYFIVDRASKDNTLALCRHASEQDHRFTTIYAPDNKNVVDAYLRGFQEAYQQGHDFIIEMDAGLSHNPMALPLFLNALGAGYDCAFGSRNIPGGSNSDSPRWRKFLSTGGTILANIFLGTQLRDMTSGYQGFRRHVVEKLLRYPLRSQAHFYQTEVRYLLRHYHQIEIPIHYQSPSPRVRLKSITNSCRVLGFYTVKRLLCQGVAL